MGLEEFVQRFNIIKPKLLALVKEYGMTNYNIDQIANHISKKDYKRVYADIGYLKDAIDEIAKKHNVTWWDTVYSADVIVVCFLSFIGLFLIGFIGFIVWDEYGHVIKNSIREARTRIHRKLYRKLYYKKHADIDPYGEEDWWD
jgi:L-rhamnose mutarotase